MNGRRIDILDMSGLLDFEPRRVRAFVRALDANLPARLRAPSGDLSVAFFDDSGIAGIHADFMNNPDPTDVITFEGDPEDGFAGEICACAETALKRAGDFGNTPSRELCLYVAHVFDGERNGALHAVQVVIDTHTLEDEQGGGYAS